MPVTPLEPRDYVVVPSVFVLDEFVMSDDKGRPVANVDKQFLEDIAKNMLGRKARTGDLSPIVIGHTEDDPKGGAEADGPPVVGYADNWQVLPFFDTGKFGLAVDCWILKTEVDRVRRFPRRSSEVWVEAREIDPISFLGATTPCRDLGLLKLSRNVAGTLVALCAAEGDIFAASEPLKLQRETTMPEVMKDKPAGDADPKQGGDYKELIGKIDALAASIEKLASGMGAPAAPAEGAAAPGEGEGDDLESLLAQLGGGDEEDDDEEDDETVPPAKGRKEEEPVKNFAGSVSKDDDDGNYTDPLKDAPVKNARADAIEEENRQLRVRLSRIEIKAELQKAASTGAAVDPEDEALVSDLVILPEDVRKRTIARLSRTKTVTATGGTVDKVLNAADKSGKKKIETPEQLAEVVKLARKKGSFNAAAEELGYEVTVRA